MAPESSVTVSIADNSEKAKEAGNPAPTLDDALMKTGYGRFHHLVFVSGGLCLLAVIAQTLGVAYLLPSAQCDLNLTTSDKGMLGAICFIGMIASSHLWGLLADTNGRRIILVITLFLDGVISIVASLAPSYWLLLICRFLNGFFVCGPSAVVYAYVGEFHAINIRARIIVWFSCFIALGFLVLPGTAWLIIPQKWVWELPFLAFKSWRLFLLLCGMPSLLTSFILMFCLPETPKFLLSKGRFEEALAVLQRMYRINTRLSPETYPVKQLPEDEYVNRNVVGGKSMVKVIWQQTWPLFSHAYILRTAVACALQFGLYASANGMVLWLPEIFSRLAEAESKGAMGTKVCTVLNNRSLELEWEEEQEECTLEVDTVVYFNTLITGCTNALAFLSGGLLVSIVGKRTVISIATLIAGVASGLVLLATTSTHVLTLAAIFSALTSMCISVVNSVVIDVFPTNLRAMAVCISLMMGRLGTALSSVCVGALLEIDCSALFYVMCGVTVVCALLATVLPRESKKKINAT